MKVRLILLFSLLWTFGAAAKDADVAEKFQQANEAYEAGNFASAIEQYEALTTEGQSTALYYNLGNAYFKNNEVAKAILNYERALKLDPADPDIQYNLKLSNDRIKDNIERLPELNISRWWNTFTLSYGVDTWGWFAIATMAVAALLFMIFLLSQIRGLRIFAFYTALLLVLFSGFGYYQASQARTMIEANTEAIVLSPRVDVKGAPSNSGINVFVIHAGTKVQVMGERDGWVNIRIASGNEGWIPQTDCAVI